MSDLRALPGARAVIERGIEARRHVGAQLYVSLDAKPVADVAIGDARAGQPLEADSLTLWMSSVKPVMGVAIAQLWERGLLQLDDPICAHVPEFAAHGKQSITVRHVLTHTGCFPYATLQWSSRPIEEIAAEICDAEPVRGWVPGRALAYHVASGWYVLAELIRRLDGRRYPDYAREAIFEPLGMLDSWVGMPPDRHAAYGDRIAPMHDASSGAPAVHDYWPWDGSLEGCAMCRPGGSAWGPIRELGRLYEMLLRGGEREGVRLLSPQSVAAIGSRHTAGMWDRTFGCVLDRGLGVVVDSKQYGPDAAWYGTRCSPRTFGHGGYQSSVGFVDPEHRLVVALVFNGMLEGAPHAARVRETVDAIYEELELG